MWNLLHKFEQLQHPLTPDSRMASEYLAPTAGGEDASTRFAAIRAPGTGGAWAKDGPLSGKSGAGSFDYRDLLPGSLARTDPADKDDF